VHLISHVCFTPGPFAGTRLRNMNRDRAECILGLNPTEMRIAVVAPSTQRWGEP
jgi:hypothetical protein